MHTMEYYAAVTEWDKFHRECLLEAYKKASHRYVHRGISCFISEKKIYADNLRGQLGLGGRFIFYFVIFILFEYFKFCFFAYDLYLKTS